MSLLVYVFHRVYVYVCLSVVAVVVLRRRLPVLITVLFPRDSVNGASM